MSPTCVTVAEDVRIPAGMIRLKCKSCATVLELDDAFAGGTCRCSHCGTIQTVPKPAPRPMPTAPKPAPKPAPTARGRAGTSGATPTSGLEELAEVVTSSGLAGSGLTGQSVFTPPPGKRERRRNLLIIAGSAVAAVLVLAALVWAFLGGKNEAPTPGSGGSGAATDSGVVPSGSSTHALAGPSFADFEIAGKTVVYVLDRGDASREYFGPLKELTLRSIASLGKDRRFLVVFWDNGEPTEGVPTTPLPATTENVAALRAPLERVIAMGRSRFAPAMQSAMAVNPDDIIIATAKAWQLDDAFVAEAMQLRGGSSTRVHTVSLGAGQGGLKDLAGKTGGQFRELPLKHLRDLLR